MHPDIDAVTKMNVKCVHQIASSVEGAMALIHEFKWIVGCVYNPGSHANPPSSRRQSTH